MGMSSDKYKLGDNMGPWGPPWLMEAAKGKRIFATYFDTPEARVAVIKKYGAGYAAFTDGMASGFAEYIRSSGVSLKMKAVQFIGGKAGELIRKDFKELLNADIVELYSSKEGGSIASPCPHGNGWHQHAESVLMEIVDEHGKPVAPGEMGRVVITPLDNYATPLIRYDQGDLAIAGPIETCSCGRTLPRIASISGRYRHTFRKPTGEVISDLPQEARVHLGSGIWQVAKIGEHSYEMRYKKRDWGVEPNIPEFLKIFHKEYYQEAELKIVEVNDFILGPTGKHMDRLDEWKPDSQSKVYQ
jgi:phenylacetate-CoA ligase